jgi:hypothetical protein
MKIMKIYFIILLLTAASLGFATPTKRTIEELNPVIGSISRQCQKTLFELATGSRFLICVPLPDILPSFLISTDNNTIEEVLSDPRNNYKTLLEEPLKKAVDSFCSAPRCSDEEIVNIIDTIKGGCEPDLSKNPLLQFIFDVTAFYPAAKDILCFKNGNVYCWDETVLTISNSPPSPYNITGIPFVDSVAVADPEEICTKCNKDIVTALFTFIDNSNHTIQLLESLNIITDETITNIKLGVAVKCGLEFEILH